MRAVCHLSMISVLLAFGGVTLSAQQPAPHFHPGQWEIDSVTTVMGGRAVSSQTQLCARHQADFWKVAQDGLTCKEPKTHPVSGGIRVRVHCVYSKESLHSEIRSDVIENITYDGNGFTLTGTTTTDTVYQGVQPKQTSAHLQVSAHRLGECP